MDKTWTQDLLDFLDRSPTCYHAVAELAAKLTAAGYPAAGGARALDSDTGTGVFCCPGPGVPGGFPGAGGTVAGICHRGSPQRFAHL